MTYTSEQQTLSSAMIPQADRVERALEYAVLCHHRQLALRDLLFEGRDALYYRSAARILGLVDGWGQATSVVEALASEDADPLELLREGFEHSEVGRAWARWGHQTLWQLDPRSAAAFLVESSELAPSTRGRRAKSLAAWHESLRPDEVGPSIEVLRGALLVRPIMSFPWSVRLGNVFHREGFSQLRDAVALGPTGLMALRDYGTRSAREFDAGLRARAPGEGLQALHQAILEGAVLLPDAQKINPTLAEQEASVAADDGAKRRTPETWDDVFSLLPKHLVELSVDRAEFPTRMQNYCTRQAITTLGALFAVPLVEVAAQHGHGRKTIYESLEAIRGVLRRYPDEASVQGNDISDEVEFDPKSCVDVLALWQAKLDTLGSDDALVLRRRSGVTGLAETLEEVGVVLEVTRERVRQREKRAVDRLADQPVWLAAVGDALRAQMGEHPWLWLSDLEQVPWLAALSERPPLAKFLLSRFFGTELAMYPWQGVLLITRERQRSPENTLRAIMHSLQESTWPGPYAGLSSAIDAVLHDDEEDLRPLFVEHLDSVFVLDNRDDPSMIFGLRSGREARILQMLAARKDPVAVAEIHETFGRGLIPSVCVAVRRGMVTLSQNIPGFDLWQQRLMPRVQSIMRDEGPGRQWMTGDLLEGVSASARVPEWLTPILLAGMMRKSGEFEDFGRQRFALAGVGDGKRVQLAPAMVEILKEAGAPVKEAVLRAELEKKTTVLDTTFPLLLCYVPLFTTGDGRVGLIDRDIPGGMDAVREAGECLEEELRMRGKGVGHHRALEVLRAQHEEFLAWTVHMVAVVPRVSASLIANRSGIGLEVWGDCRVLSQSDRLRELLDAGEGVARVSALAASIIDLQGHAPTRGTLGSVASQVGARLRGELIVLNELADEPGFDASTVLAALDASLAEESSAQKTAPVVLESPMPMPMPTPMPEGAPTEHELKIPREARSLYRKLAHEAIGDWDALLTRSREHVGKFETLMASNEFLPVDDAKNIMRVLEVLAAKVRQDPGSVAERLVWIAGRYFEIEDDGDMDFAIGGLDDDIAVINAVAVFMGESELEIEYS